MVGVADSLVFWGAAAVPHLIYDVNYLKFLVLSNVTYYLILSYERNHSTQSL
jgi:hypothetical protein